MKILKIRLMNLNSLAGTFEIDLTSPPFQDGIFAISGPTGAGKTTILDALCLALYGETPRLNQITKTSNEIMTRLCGECMAETEFSTGKGSFRCRWYQHRARKAPDGELQPARREIVDLVTGTPLSTKAGEVSSLVEELTGMTFDRFTRSILLAQGRFAAFLDARVEERAEILEQITGTEIYADISMAVQKRAALEQSRLSSLKAGIDLIPVLSGERRSELREEMAGLQVRIADADDRLEKYREWKAWQEGISRLDRDLATAEEETGVLNQKKAEAAPLLETLESGRRAAGIAPEYRLLEHARNRKDEAMALFKDVALRIPVLETEHTRSSETLQAARNELEEVKEALERERRIIVEVRELDRQIREADRILADLKNTYTALRDEKEELTSRIHQSYAEHDEARQERDRAVTYLSDHGNDGALLAELSVIREISRTNSESCRTIRELETEISASTRSLSIIHEDCNALHIRLETVEKERKAIVTAREQNIAGYTALLAGRSQTFLSEQEEQLREKTAQFELFIRLEQDLTGITADVLRREDRITSLMNDTGILEREYAEIGKQQEILEERLHTIREQVRREEQVKNLVQYRHELQENVPCPLCGSLHHPYQKDEPVCSDHGELEREERILSGYRQDNQERVIRIARNQTLILQEQDEITRVQERARAREQEIADLNPDNQPAPGQTTMEPVSSRLSRCREELETIHLLIRKIREYEEKIRDDDGRLAEIGERYRRIEQELGLAVQKEVELTARITSLQREYDNHLTSYTNGRLRFSRMVSPYVPVLSPEEDGEVLSVLSIRSVQFQEMKDLLSQKEGEMGQISILMTGLKDRRERVCAEITGITGQISESELSAAHIQKKRFQLYGDGNPDAGEKILSDRLVVAESSLGAAQDAFHRSHTDLSLIHQQLRLHEESVTVLSNEVFRREKDFGELLRRSGFRDEADFLLYLCDPDELVSLETLDRTLRDEETALVHRIQDIRDARDGEQKKNLTNLTGEEIDDCIRDEYERREGLSKKIWGIETTLRDDSENQENRLRQEEALLGQKKEADRWGLLNELIGSHDGKKFRTYAQGITFDLLLDHTNRHLEKMTDRYRLVSGGRDHPLDLLVVDTWQADEIRSCKNLSGGESFIVSLALALGLSGMSSRNVRVDSLFLDEGFGTLDAEALDLALDTLSGLRQEGKQIGIISHVEVLRDRIPARIIVEKISMGRSRIILPDAAPPG